jgi:putative ABC transport system permease protein
VQAINGEARASYARAAAVAGQDRFETLAREDGARFGEQAFIDLRRAGWLVSPVFEGEMRFGSERLRILGIDPLSMPQGASEVDIAGEAIGLQAFITPPGVLVVSPETARRLGGQSSPPLRIAEQLPPGTALTDIGIAQQLLGEQGQLSRLILWPEQLPSARPLAEVAPDLVRKPPAARTIQPS